MAFGNNHQTVSNAAQGGNIDGEIEEKSRQLNAELNEAIVDLRNHHSDVTTQSKQSTSSPQEATDVAASKIAAEGHRAASQMEAARKNKLAAEDNLRQFQILHGLARTVKHPDIALSTMLFACLMIVEGVLTSLFFYSGGYVSGVAEALGLGLTISGVNILLSGVIGGGIFGKFWNYGLDAPEDDPVFRKQRLAGRAACFAVALLIIFVLLLSGIVRATGETEHLSYSLTSLATAASDFHSILLWVVGGCFAVLAWRKGLSAFSDPYPGYSEAANAERVAQNAIDFFHEDALGTIEDHHENASDDLLDMADSVADEAQRLIENVQDLSHYREKVLGKIDAAKRTFTTFVAKKTNTHRKTNPSGHDETQKLRCGIDVEALRAQVPTIAIDVSAFSKSSAVEHQRALNSLLTARQSAIEKVETAYLTAMNDNS